MQEGTEDESNIPRQRSVQSSKLKVIWQVISESWNSHFDCLLKLELFFPRLARPGQLISRESSDGKETVRWMVLVPTTTFRFRKIKSISGRNIARMLSLKPLALTKLINEVVRMKSWREKFKCSPAQILRRRWLFLGSFLRLPWTCFPASRLLTTNNPKRPKAPRALDEAHLKPPSTHLEFTRSISVGCWRYIFRDPILLCSASTRYQLALLKPSSPARPLDQPCQSLLNTNTRRQTTSTHQRSSIVQGISLNNLSARKCLPNNGTVESAGERRKERTTQRASASTDL